MDIPPNFPKQPEASTNEPSSLKRRFGPLSSNTLEGAAKVAKASTPHFSLRFNQEVPATELVASSLKNEKTMTEEASQELKEEELQQIKDEVQQVLQGIFEGEDDGIEELSTPKEDPFTVPFTSIEGGQPAIKGEQELINEVLYRLEKGFLSLQINDYEVFSSEIFFNLLGQIQNPKDRLELLSHSLLHSFAHMAMTQEGDESVVHILELASPPQKILIDLPHLYEVTWLVYPEGVVIEKESQYALITLVKNTQAEETIPLYHYAEVIDFRAGQEKHHIEIEPTSKAFDPVHHRLLWTTDEELQ